MDMLHYCTDNWIIVSTLDQLHQEFIIFVWRRVSNWSKGTAASNTSGFS